MRAGSLFPEWQEQHAQDVILPKRILVMHAMNGKAEGKFCKTCKHLMRFKQSARWMKCSKSKITGGAGTDWKASFPACGLHDEVSGNDSNTRSS